jgi:tetratricopeptide (TPR) repeat protein
MTRLVAWCLGLCVWVASASGALADDPTDVSSAQRRAAGEALLDSGKRAVKQGRYSEALRDFEQALARLKQPTIHYYIGDTAARMGDDARALAAFRDYLGAVPDAPDRAAVERRIAAHERKLAEGGGNPSATATGDLSPEAAAQAAGNAEGDQAQAAGAEVDDRNGGGLWWLWTGIGVAVVASIVAAVIVTNADDPVQPARRGDVGGTIQTIQTVEAP